MSGRDWCLSVRACLKFVHCIGQCSSSIANSNTNWGGGAIIFLSTTHPVGWLLNASASSGPAAIVSSFNTPRPAPHNTCAARFSSTSRRPLHQTRFLRALPRRHAAATGVCSVHDWGLGAALNRRVTAATPTLIGPNRGPVDADGEAIQSEHVPGRGASGGGRVPCPGAKHSRGLRKCSLPSCHWNAFELNGYVADPREYGHPRCNARATVVRRKNQGGNR